MKTLKGQMRAFVAMICLLFLAFTGITVYHSYNKLYDSRKEQLETGVQIVYNIANDFEKLAEQGKLSEDEAKRQAILAIKNAKYDNGVGYFYIFGMDGLTVMHPPHPEWDGVKRIENIETSPGVYGIVKMRDALLNSPSGKALVEINFPKAGETEPVPKLQYVVNLESWGWMIGSGLYIDDLDDLLYKEIGMLLLQGFIAVVILMAMSTWLVRSVFSKIGGEPLEAIAIMKRVATGDLSVAIDTKYNDSLLAYLNRMIKDLSNAIHQIKESAGEISVASKEIQQGNLDLSNRTEETAMSLQSIAASSLQISEGAKLSYEHSKESEGLTQQAAKNTEQGKKAVSDVVATMDQIKDASAKISEITSVIDGIAFQTNILSLNAAVEAARAGDAGKGFAVVAGEVRNLALKSATAAKEIRELIANSSSLVAKGHDLVSLSEDKMTQIDDSIHKIESMIKEINISTKEQTDGINQINNAINGLDGMTQQNAALVEEATSASGSMNEQVSNLYHSISKFKMS